MIEAFEIGITLALDNGVASGIAAIRQDLDALDRAIASSSAGLATLRRLSAGIQPPAVQSTNIWSTNPVHPANQAPAPPPIPLLAGTFEWEDTAPAASAAIAPELPTPLRPTVTAIPDHPAPTRTAAPRTDPPHDHRTPFQVITPGATHEPPSTSAMASNINPISSPDAAKSLTPTPSRLENISKSVPAPQAVSSILSHPPVPHAAPSMHTPPEQRSSPWADDLPTPPPPSPLPAEFVPTVALAPARPTPIQSDYRVPSAPNRPAVPSMFPSRSVSSNGFETHPNRRITPTPPPPRAILDQKHSARRDYSRRCPPRTLDVGSSRPCCGSSIIRHDWLRSPH